jgi:predicted transcriptional regulator
LALCSTLAVDYGTSELDEDMIKKKSRIQRWKNDKMRHMCRKAYRCAPMVIKGDFDTYAYDLYSRAIEEKHGPLSLPQPVASSNV